MKAKVLQINDWVRYKESKYPFQVLTISYMGVALPSTGGHNQHESDFEPIPLTEDILKANGIPIDGISFFFKEDKELKLELTYIKGLVWSINCCEYIILEFKYVHQLQHALRLCGLDDLADNFKVE